MTQSIRQSIAIYFSPTSTTKQVVEAIGASISDDTGYFDITLPDTRSTPTPLRKNDLLVIGLPVYGGRIPLIVNDYLNSLRGDNTPVIIIGVYGNRDYDDMLLEMKDILSGNGFIPLAAGAFIGEHSYTSKVATNRPDAKDLDKIKAFANKALSILEHKDLNELTLNVRGNSPYKERKQRPPLGPVVQSTCTQCGTCVAACPSGALTLTDQLKVDDLLCIQCCSCVKKCPNEGITFEERIPDFETFLIENCSERREADVFYAD